LFMQLIVCAFCLALARAGSISPAINATAKITGSTEDNMIPVIAIPEPVSRPWLCLIRPWAMMPRTRPTGAVIQVNNPKMPQTNEAPALPPRWGGPGTTLWPGAGSGGGMAGDADANSGNSDSDFHSLL